MPPPTAVSAHDLARHFGAVRAVDGLTFTIPSGQVVGLLGHNGAGKTTTIRILNGLLQPTFGETYVLGMDPQRSGPKIRARTGVLTEQPSLDERLTARENLRFSAELFGVAAAAASSRIDDLLERFGLSERAADRVGGFSRGMKQRLALARALIHDPELLFLDEPTAALDPVAARDVHDLIRTFADEPGRTVVITTHNLVEAQRLCDRVIILRRGRSIADGTPAELSRHLAGSGRVEVDVDPAQLPEAVAAARAAADGTQVEHERETLTVSGLGHEGLPALVAALVRAGISVYRVMPSEPSLEDAYFALHADEEKGRGDA
jgi:ABC-2 type transport system ATP-binding protein